METLVKTTLAEAKRDKEIAVETLRVESATAAAEKEITREKALRESCDLEVQKVRDTEFAARVEMTTRLELEFRERLQGVEERHEGVVTDLQTRHDEVRKIFSSYYITHYRTSYYIHYSMQRLILTHLSHVH